MPETTSQINITEPSADVKPYLEFLRNAAFGLVFSPQALQRSGLPGTANLWGNLPQQTPATSVPSPITPPIDVPYEILPVAEMRSLARQASSPGTRWMAHSSRMAEGGLARSAAEIERTLADVLLGPGGSPIGGIYPGLEVSPPVRIPSQIGTGTRVPPTPQRPNVSPLPPIISTPPTGTLPVLNPNPTLVQPPPGMPGGQLPPVPQPTAPPTSAPPVASAPPSAPPAGPSAPPAQSPLPQFVTQQPENFAGAAQASATGYNPNQYADQSVAERLAQQMGGQLQYTNVAGPIGPPSQATLNFGGAAQLNAGLVNQYMQEKDPSTREMNLRMLRDEISRLGGVATFAKGGTVRAQEGLFAGPAASVSPRGQLGFGNILNNAPAPGTERGFGQPSRLSTTALASSPAPAPASPFPAAPTTQNVTAPPAFGQAPPEMMQGVLNPYQRFQGQRVLGLGANFGQVGAVDAQGRPTELQVSDPTRAALQGLQRLPSYFDEYGNVRADRVDGVATTNLGIANDVFDVAGNQALSAAQTAGSLFDRNDVRSSFQDTMSYLRQNPTAFQAGDITLGQLGTPQLDAPLGVAPSALTSFQMEGPMTVDASGSKINPLAVMGEQITGLPSLTQFQMAGPREVQAGGIAPTAVERQQIRDIIASNQGMNVTGEGYGATAMNDPRRFIDTGVSTSYMSPYQKQVIDTQLQEARRAFDEQRQIRNAQAIRAGAFGGGRQAVAESIAERDLANQQQNIVAQGLQSAFENAQAQFERDRAAGMSAQARNQEAANQAAQFGAANRQQAALANQANAQQFGLANLQALLQTQQLGANLGQQAALANQQAALEAARANQQAGLQSQLANQAAQQEANRQNLAAALGVQELGANQQFTAAQARAQMGQQAQLANQQAMLEAARANQQTGLQAQLANQAAIQQARQQNLAAALGVQELGAQQSLAAQQANQAAGLTAGRENLQAALATQQLGRQTGLSAAQANQQTRLAQNQALLDAAVRADQLAQQAAQSNVANRLAALGQQTQSSLAANQIGQSRADLQRLAQAMELQNLQALQQGGGNIDARTQQILDLGYQDFINQRNFPYQQLNFLTGLLANMPQSVNQEQVLFQRTNPLSQIAGLTTAGLGALQAGLQR